MSGSGSEQADSNELIGERKYPKDASIRLAAKEGSQRFYFRTPIGSIKSVVAMDVEQARELAADGVVGFGPEDYEQPDATEFTQARTNTVREVEQ